ncbi:MAG: dienelactone hydrolase family protein [Burkholderiales bacterium]|nr:MAG: dienelactone hydrolase family protein [Burkholderiales bacterium]
MLCSLPAHSQELDASLDEQVVMIAKKGGLFSFELETTVYKPDGDGPFPLVIINHGKSFGDPRFQGRSRHSIAARFFLQRGYAVLMPMRQGFSKSTGSYIGGGCNIDSNGLQQAQDTKAALDWAVSQSWADKNNILIMGQSHGGWTTLAFGTLNYPGVKGLVNFAGGLKQESCAGWEGSLARAAGGYGKDTKVPSVWFYGDNDSFFAPYTFRPMFEKYTAAGAKAELVAFGNFGSDAHMMFGSRDGIPIWQPKVGSFMQEVGLPTAITHAKFGNAPSVTPKPPKTDFAALDDETKLPHVKDTGRAGYKNFLTKQLPRAFALAPNGAWGWAEMGDDPLKRAIDSCNRNGQGQCKLYAVDDLVVWQP